MHRLDTWLRSIGQIRRRYTKRESTIRSTEDERIHENERESYINRDTQRQRWERKEKRTKSGEVEKMIFNISDRLHLITRIVRAGTCNSARG